MDGWVDGWMDGLVGGWMDGWMGVWVGGWVSEWVGGWVGGWLDGWMDGCMGGWVREWVGGLVGGWVDGWMEGWVDGGKHHQKAYLYDIGVLLCGDGCHEILPLKVRVYPACPIGICSQTYMNIKCQPLRSISYDLSIELTLYYSTCIGQKTTLRC